jgi:hypothetical protein
MVVSRKVAPNDVTVETSGCEARGALLVWICEGPFPFQPSDTGEGIDSVVKLVAPPNSEFRVVLVPVQTRHSQGPEKVSHDCSESGVAEA